jgi:putative transposase
MDEEERTRKMLRRYAMVDLLVTEKVPRGQRSTLLKEQSKRYNVSVSTLKRYCKRFEEQRQEGLKPKASREDKGKPRKIPPEILQRAVELREADPGRSTADIVAMLDRLFPEHPGQIKRSTLARHLKRLGKTRQLLLKEQKAGYRHFRKRHKGDLWETDICLPDLQVRDTDGQVKKAVLVAILDNATGFCVAAGFHTAQDGGIVESCLKSALTEHGLPAAIYQDNGAQFVAEQIREACGWLGIRHLRARPRYGEGKGQIERFWRTVQESLVREVQLMAHIPTVAQLNTYLRAWIEEYYHQRPYSDLRKPPAALWEEDPTQLPRVDAVTLEAAFLLRVERRVSKTALVSLNGVKFLVHDDLAGEMVQVRYHPRQRERIQIWMEGRFVQYAEPYEVPTNSPKRPKTEPATVPRKKGGPNLVEMLVREREQKLAARVQALRSQGRTAPPLELGFTESEFVTLLCELLQRSLEPLETEWAFQTWRRCGGLDRDRTTVALTRFAAHQGLKMHLSYYLDTVERAHLQARKGGAAHI